MFWAVLHPASGAYRSLAFPVNAPDLPTASNLQSGLLYSVALIALVFDSGFHYTRFTLPRSHFLMDR